VEGESNFMTSNGEPDTGTGLVPTIRGPAQRLVVAVSWVYQRADDRGVYGMVKFRFSVKVPLADLIQEGGFEKFEKQAREALEEELEKLRGVRGWGVKIMAKAPANSNAVAAPTSISKSKEDKP
jgi:hypothetical protein